MAKTRNQLSGKEGLIERAYTLSSRLDLAVWCEDEAGPFRARAAPGQQLATTRPACHAAARICPRRHDQDPDPVPPRYRTSVSTACHFLHQFRPAWLAQEGTDGDPGEAANTERAG